MFNRLGVDLDRISIDETLFRPNDIPDIFGSNEKAKSCLGWEYDLTGFDVMDLILEETKSIEDAD